MSSRLIPADCHPIMSTKQLNRWPVFLISSQGNFLVLCVMWYVQRPMLHDLTSTPRFFQASCANHSWEVPDPLLLSAMSSMTTFITGLQMAHLRIHLLGHVSIAGTDPAFSELTHLIKSHFIKPIKFVELSTDDLPAAFIVMICGLA